MSAACASEEIGAEQARRAFHDMAPGGCGAKVNGFPRLSLATRGKRPSGRPSDERAARGPISHRGRTRAASFGRGVTMAQVLIMSGLGIAFGLLLYALARL